MKYFLLALLVSSWDAKIQDTVEMGQFDSIELCQFGALEASDKMPGAIFICADGNHVL